MKITARVRALAVGLALGLYVALPSADLLGPVAGTLIGSAGAAPANGALAAPVVTYGDFDGDGVEDAVVRTLSGSAEIRLGTGSTEPTRVVQAIGPSYLGVNWSPTSTAIVAGDFNGDGRDDLFVQAAARGAPAHILYADATGRFDAIGATIPFDHLGFEWTADATQIVAGDFTGDGRAEALLQANDPTGLFYVIHGSVNGPLVAHGQGWIDDYLARDWAAEDTRLYAGDFDGDGRADLLQQPSLATVANDPAATYALIVADADGRFTRVHTTWDLDDLGAEWDPRTHELRVGDFDRDGIADVWLRARLVGGADHLVLGTPRGLSTAAMRWSDGRSATQAYAARGRATRTPPAVVAAAIAAEPVLAPVEQLMTPDPAEKPAAPTEEKPADVDSTPRMMATSHGTEVVGALAGEAGVSGGAASYAVNIVVPPGRNGMQPSVSLNYSSRGGNGELGIGWGLSAGSSIHRCAATEAQDGYNASVVFDAALDRLCLDGQKLKRESGTYGTAGAVYRTELESFARVEQVGAITANGGSFVVKYKDGRIGYYGYNTNSQLGLGALNAQFQPESRSGTLVSAPLAWGLGRIEDRHGNRMVFGYSTPRAGEYHLAEIRYTGTATTQGTRKVLFTWEDRTDIASSYQGGGRTPQTKRLAKVQTLVGTEVVREYYLGYHYSAATGRSLLNSIEECAVLAGVTSCFAPTTFAWRDAAPVNNFAQITLPGFDSSQGEYHVEPAGDVDGDGRSEMRLSGHDLQGNQIYKLVWLDGKRNIERMVDVPPLSSVGTPGMGYDFDQDGRNDVLGLQNNEYVINYWVADPYQPNAPTDIRQIGVQHRPGLDGNLRVLDLNSDGWVDLVQDITSSTPANGHVLKWWRNNGRVDLDGDGTVEPREIQFVDMGEIYDLPEGNGLLPGSVVHGTASTDDVNGDGRVDITLSEPMGNGNWRQVVLINRTTVGGPFAYVRKTYGQMGIVPSLETAFYRFADLNGDGLSDFLWAKDTSNGRRWAIQFNRGADTTDTALSSMYGAAITTDSNAGLQCDLQGCNTTPFAPRWGGEMRFVDVDNDGRAELLYPGLLKAAWCIMVMDYNFPAGPEPREICGNGHYSDELGSPDANYSLYQWNAVRFSENAARTTVTVSDFATPLLGTTFDTEGGDIFGDGLNDVFTQVPRDLENVAYYGLPQSCGACYIPATRGLHANTPTVNLSSNDGNELFPAPDFMTSASDGLGRSAKWEYVPLSVTPPRRSSGGSEVSAPMYYVAPSFSDPSRYAGPDHAYTGMSMYAVESFRTSHGADPAYCAGGPDCASGYNTVRFSYGEGVMNTKGRGFQGFRTIIEEDLSAQLRTTTTFHQKFPNAGQVQSVVVQPMSLPLASTDAVARTTNAWTCADSDSPTASCLRTGIGTYVPFLESSTEQRFELGAYATAVTTTTQVNTGSSAASKLVGCPSKSVQAVEDAIYRTETTTELTGITNDETANWWLCKVNTKQVDVAQTCNSALCPSHTIASSGRTVSSYAYNNTTRRVTSDSVTVTSGPVAGTVVRSTTYGYDTYGNTNSVVAGGSVDGVTTPSRTTTSLLTTDGYFVRQVTQQNSPVNLVNTRTVSTRYGEVLTTTDPNGVVTTNTYDAFGRAVTSAISSAAGTLPTRTTYLNPCVGCDDLPSKYKVTVIQPGAPTSVAWYDMHGRVLRTSTEGFDGSLWTRVTQHDSLGRAVRSSEPVLGNTPVHWNRVHQFDALGRPTLSEDAKGNDTTFVYDGLETAITITPADATPGTRTTRQWKDSLGRLVRTIDPLGSSTYFRYDAFSNPVLIRDPANNRILSTFNAAGHKLSLVDPDMGSWTYAYNVFGELVRQTDAKGQVTDLVIDNLGRVKSRTEGGEISTWNWDTASYGKGKPASVTQAPVSAPTAFTHSESYEYDAFSRPISATTTFDGASHRVDTSYDAYGRVDTITYPQGLVNQAPIIDAGPDQSRGRGVTVNLAGTATDPDGVPSPMTVSWQQLAGPAVTLTGPTTLTPSFYANLAGTYQFQLSATDGLGTSIDQVTVAVTNAAPIARAGADQTVVRGSVVYLNGSTSSDPDAGPNALTYSWSQSSGPVVTLTGPTTAQPSFTSASSGVHVFGLTVNDGQASGTDSVAITVNAAPTASAVDFSAQTNGSTVITLTGASTDDGFAAPLTYSWQQLAGPTVTLSNATTTMPSFTAATAGSYQFRFTAYDGHLSTSDDMTATIGWAAPGVPSGVAASAPASNGSHSVSWTAPSGAVPVTRYDVYRSANGSGYTLYTNTTATSIAVGATASGYYSYKVAACNSTGCGAQSTASNQMVHVVAPNMTAVNPVFGEPDSTVELVWSGPADGGAAEQFQIRRWHNGNEGSPIMVSGSTFYYVFTSLGLNDHEFAVRSCLQGVCSADGPVAYWYVGGGGGGQEPLKTAPPAKRPAVAPRPSDEPNADTPTVRKTGARASAWDGAHLMPLRLTRAERDRAHAVKAAQGSGGTTRFAVKHEYTATGYLAVVRDVNSGLPYWQATAMDARGNVTQELFGNAVTTTRTVDAASGYVTDVDSQRGGVEVQDLGFGWDSLGNLRSRRDRGLTETFTYDALNRVLTGQVSGSSSFQSLGVSYDAIGNITAKNGVGTTYGYGSRPHAVTAVTGGPVALSYGYDANGNMQTRTRGATTSTVQWSAANLPTRIEGNGEVAQFKYAPSRARYWQQSSYAGRTETTRYVGTLFEQMHRSDTGVTEYRYHVKAGGQTVATVEERSNFGKQVNYLHRDHLGSVQAVTNESGAIVRYAYDAHGNRRDGSTWQPQLKWSADAATINSLRDTASRGFTDHEMLDNVSLVHMNGRVYDPEIARFMSVDPLFEFPTNTQSLNPYSYVLNNPLSLTDPSGYGTDASEETEAKLEKKDPVITDAKKYKVASVGSHIKKGVQVTGKLDGKSFSVTSLPGAGLFTSGALQISGGNGSTKKVAAKPETANSSSLASAARETTPPVAPGDRAAEVLTQAPVDSNELTSRDPETSTADGQFGNDGRTDKSGAKKQHNGCDIKCPVGSPVVAAGDGRVTNAPGADNKPQSKTWGRWVGIRHGTSGVFTVYAHLARAFVTVGQDVHAGQLIGLVGKSGNAPLWGDWHLHFEIWVDGKAINPALVFPMWQQDRGH